MKKKKLLVLVTIAVMCLSIFAVMLTGCKDKKFTVAFDSDGGNEISSVEGKVEEEPVPIKEGYNFLGWYMENSESRVEFPFEPTANITLKAKWEVKGLPPIPPDDDEPQPTDRELTASAIVGYVTDVLSENTKFNANNNYGIQLGISIAGVNIAFETVVDPKNSSSLKMGLKIKKDSADIFQLLADDEYLYAISNNSKRRFTDVNLAELTDMIDVNMSSTTALANLALQLAMSSIFSGDTEVVKTNDTYTLDGTLENILDLLKLFNVELPSGITDILKSATLTLTTDIIDGKASNVKLGIADINGAEIGVTKLSISNDEIPQIDVPSKTDKSFVETYLLNYSLNGSVVLQNRQNDYTVKNMVKYDYELRVNFNIMEAIRNCLTKDSSGKIAFEAANLFKTKDSKIFFDLTHTCSNECAEYCNNKEGAARGSILSVAYSPADFNSENINIAINLKNILPKGLISSFIDLGGINLVDMFGEYVGLTLNPEALIASGAISSNSEETTPDVSEDENTQISIETNYIGVILDALKFIGSITLTQSEGLKMNTDDLTSMVDRFSPALNVNLGNMLSMFFREANVLNIKIDDSFSGDTSIANMNMYHRYMTIDPSIGDYKSFINGSNDFTPAVNFEWNRDADGNVKFADESAYVEDHMITMSADEIRQLLNGSLSYSYTRLDGKTGQSIANIIKVSGIDYSITDQPQRVLLVTDMVDGGALSGLLSLVSIIMPDIKISIPGAVVYIDITIASVQSVELTQGVDVQNAYDENKTYKKGDLLNPQFTATLTYGNGESKELTLDPDCLATAFSNWSNRNSAVIDRFGTFDLVYSAFGRTFVKTVKMENQLGEQTRTPIELEIGQEYSVNYYLTNIPYTENGETKTTTVRGSEAEMEVLSKYESMSSEKTFTQSFFGAQFSGWKFSFSESGEYEVDVYIGKGYTAKYVVTVKEPVPIMPGYALNLDQAGPDTICATVTRTDQLGEGLNTSIKVELQEENGSYITLESGVDYEIYVNGQKKDTFFLDSFLIKPFEFQVKMLAYGEKTLKVTLNAVDYNDAEIVVQENTFDIVSMFAGYNITSEVTENLAKDSQDGVLIKVSPTVDAGKEVEGLTIKVVVEVKIGEGEWTELTSKGADSSNEYDEVYMTSTSFWGTTLYGLSSADIVVSADGNGENGVQYIRIQKPEVKNATEDVQYRISLIATSHDNQVIATSTGTISVA